MMRSLFGQRTTRRWQRTRHEGQAVVMVAFAFVLLVAALGLGIDAANAFGQRRLANNAADAAALAATRTLVGERLAGSGTAINSTIATYMAREGNAFTDAISWQAFYVRRNDLTGSLGVVTDGLRPPNGVDGIRVEVEFRTPTAFMALFGQRNLTVRSFGTAVFGPLGTAVGQDLAPLALSDSGLQRLMDQGEVRLDLDGGLSASPPLRYLDPSDPEQGFVLPIQIPDDVVSFDDLRMVSFADTNLTPLVGNDCAAASPVNSLSYWWCRGSPHMLRIGRELPQGTVDNPGMLRSVITWRHTNRNVLVLPVYTESLRFVGGEPESFLELRNFVAVEILSFGDDYDTGVGRIIPYRDILRVRWLRNYGTAGAMVGEGSATEVTELWAVNLVR
ncbi:MAG: pilus assembly protein TadG-related protein [Oscillochloridaceae bacterium umkhey_bin13]